MGKGAKNYIKVYLSKLKKTKEEHASSKLDWLLSACNYPRTPSFASGRRHPKDLQHRGNDDSRAATLADIDRFLFENFNSLYAADTDDVTEGSTGSPDYTDDTPPLDLRSSQRFFATPGTSNSLMEEARCSCAASASSPSSPSIPSDTGNGFGVPDECTPVVTFSKDPQEDFLRSMEEMVEARHAGDESHPMDWGFMEDLLFCYLDLNDRKVHKHIVRAFTDLIASMQRRNADGTDRTEMIMKKRRPFAGDP